MPAIDTEAQFKFLLSCIKHSAQGKVSDTQQRAVFRFMACPAG